MNADPHLDWERLGELVVARRVRLGYKKRPAFSAASGISTRILGDIETGRRSSYDPTTIAALENTLGWRTGSAQRIVHGHDPIVLDEPGATTDLNPGEQQDKALTKVMRSGLSDEQKARLMKLLISEKEDAERRRVEHAEQLIRLFDEE